jgi:hypothetical protein
MVDNSGPPRPGTGDFVITDPGIATLSVRALIAIPVAMVAAVGTVLLLGLLPSPWRVSNALNATVLYSHLHEREEKEVGEDAEWDREGAVAFSLRNGEAQLEPVYRERSGEKKVGYYWFVEEREDGDARTAASERVSLASLVRLHLSYRRSTNKTVNDLALRFPRHLLPTATIRLPRFKRFSPKKRKRESEKRNEI